MLLYRARFRDSALASRPPNQSEAEQLGPGLTPVYPEALAVEVQTPRGPVFAVDDPALIAALAGKGAEPGDLSLIHSDRALTDCRPVSLISLRTMQQLGDETGAPLDRRRFRANICAELTTGGIHLYRQSEVNRLALKRANAKRAPLAASRDGGRR